MTPDQIAILRMMAKSPGIMNRRWRYQNNLIGKLLRERNRLLKVCQAIDTDHIAGTDWSTVVRMLRDAIDKADEKSNR